MGGDILDTQPMPVELAETLGKRTRRSGAFTAPCSALRDNRQLIIDKFPKLNRFLTGYDLRHVFNDEMTEFDLTRVLTGSEGRWRLLPKRGWISPVCRKCAAW
jgi:FAD/FMN-containing dehydrogenase